MGSRITNIIRKTLFLIRQKSFNPFAWFKWRLFVQIGFVILCIWIGWEFSNFVIKLRNDLPVAIDTRPPGVEGFLPISSLMELWILVKSGIVMKIHPAGVIILLFAIGTAVLIRRGFCSWLCPIGTLSEFMWRLGRIIGLNWIPPRWLDYPFRSLKYILLSLFLYIILGMSSKGLIDFISGDYNRVSDIKMLDFFMSPSQLTISIIGILVLVSLVLKNFWCRYLCPYGALLGFFSRFSPMAIRRNSVTCINCNKCNKACPSYLPVATSLKIKYVECLACQQCVMVCPVKDCLQFSNLRNKLAFRPLWYGVVFLFLFLGSVGIARFFGYWKTTTPIEQLRILSKQSSHLSHPRSISGY